MSIPEAKMVKCIEEAFSYKYLEILEENGVRCRQMKKET